MSSTLSWRLTQIEPYESDATDQKLLSALQKDCRISNTDIAHTLRISKASVTYRIRRLEEKKIIHGYLTHVDIFKLGFRGVLIRLSVNGPPARQKECAELLAHHPQVLSVYTAFRPFNLMIGVIYETENDLSSFLSFIKKNLGVSNYEVVSLQAYSAMSVDYSQKNVEIFSRKNNYSVPKKQTFTLVPFHAALLGLLSRHARKTVTQLAEETHTHKSTVKKALNDLVNQKIIIKFTASVNPYSIPGTFLAAWWMSFPDADEIRRLRTWLHEKKCSNGFVQAVGKYNVIAFTFFHSPQSLASFEESFNEQFPHCTDYRMELLKEQAKSEWFSPFMEERLLSRMKETK